MTQQMRKFEQEAIASQIVEKIKEQAKVMQKDFEGSDSYKKIMIISNEIRQLDQEREDISDKMSTLKKNLSKKLEVFNANNDLGFTYEVRSNYDGSLVFADEYGRTQEHVEQKLAVALLASDWSDNLPQIIEDIANQFNNNL